MTLSIGSRVRVTRSGANGAQVINGDLGTVTEINGYGSAYVRMDSPRNEGCYTYKDGGPHWIFEEGDVEVMTLAVGDVRTIVGDSYEDDPHGILNGTSVTVVSLGGSDGRVTVQRDGAGWSYYVTRSDIGEGAPVVPEAEVTLPEWKIMFLKGAVARGEANGTTHSAQVTEALDNLARLEFLEPSTDLESFQKRVVALAMQAKGKHTWCGEPEAFLTEIGLKHLLPVTKIVKVITEIHVQATPDMSEYDIRSEARRRAGLATDGDFWTDTITDV